MGAHLSVTCLEKLSLSQQHQVGSLKADEPVSGGDVTCCPWSELGAGIHGCSSHSDRVFMCIFLCLFVSPVNGKRIYRSREKSLLFSMQFKCCVTLHF